MGDFDLGNLLKNKIIISSLLGCLPFFFSIFVVFLVMLLVLGIVKPKQDVGGDGSLVYDDTCDFEKTMVTVMDGSNTKVLATVSLEDYVIGVSCPEIGACSGASATLDEDYVKTQYVVAKTYSLARGNYNSSTKSISVRASTKDQQWCSLEKGCIVTKTSEIVPGTSSVFYNTYPGDYTESQMEGSYDTSYSYTAEDLEIFHKYYQDIYGELFVSDSYKSTISSLGGGDATEFKASTQDYWNEQAKSGKSYKEILDGMANSGVTDSEDYVGKSLYKLGDYCKATGSSGSGGALVDLGDYPDVTAKSELTKSIESSIGSGEIDKLNDYIKDNVKKAGKGTGDGVAAAASSLIYGLYQKGYYLPYWFGGGHGSLATGVDKSWGKSGSSIQPSYVGSNSPRERTVYSYDCSGFVSWAIKNGCKSNFAADSTTGFISNYGNSSKASSAISSAKPGDLMVYDEGGGKNGHVRLVIESKNGKLLTAESTSGYANHGSVLFHEYSNLYDGGHQYYIVSMSKWYSKNCD